MDVVEFTATGRYYHVYVNDVEVSKHSTEREAGERCINELFTDPTASVTYAHEYEVSVVLTTAGITLANISSPPLDTPPVIDEISSAIEPIFNETIADTYDMNQHVIYSGQSPLVWAITGVLPNGLSFNTVSGVLTYDGIGAQSVSSHTLQVSNATGGDESSLFNIVIDQPITISLISDINIEIGGTPHDMSQYINDPSMVMTTSFINGLTSFASYDAGTLLLTGVTAGTEVAVTLSAQYGVVGDLFVTSNTFNINVNAPPTGGDFFVAKTGNDSNPGTEASPKLTNVAAIGLLTPDAGETIIVKTGLYNEGLNSIPSGTSWAGAATIKANPGDNVRLSKTGGSAPRVAVWNNKSYIIMDGFTVNSDSGQLWNGFKYDGTTDHIRMQNMDIGTATFTGVQDSSEDGVGGHEFLNCLIHDNGQTGFDHGIYMVTAFCKVWNCEFFNNSGYGIQFWVVTADVDDGDVQYNICRNNGAGGAKGGMTINGARNLIANNLVYDNTNGGIYIFAGSDNKVYNNTCFSNSGGEGGINAQRASCIDTLFTNNISFANGVNIKDNGTGSVFTTNQTTDPSFVNSGNDDFHLLAGSSARNAGTTLAEVTDDFDGVSRPQESAYDIGAYEYIT